MERAGVSDKYKQIEAEVGREWKSAGEPRGEAAKKWEEGDSKIGEEKTDLKGITKVPDVDGKGNKGFMYYNKSGDIVASAWLEPGKFSSDFSGTKQDLPGIRLKTIIGNVRMDWQERGYPYFKTVEDAESSIKKLLDREKIDNTPKPEK
jgi:hypothetical protein